MVWLIIGIIFLCFMMVFAITAGEFELIIGGFLGAFIIFMGMNGLFSLTLDQARTYEIKPLVAIDGTGSLIEIDDEECYYNNGSGIETVTREKCEIVESARGEMKTTHYTPDSNLTVFEWAEYNRFYVTREQISYGN